MSKLENFHWSEKPLHKTWEIDKVARTSKKVEMKSPMSPMMLKSLARCRTMFLFAVFCKIGALERNAY